MKPESTPLFDAPLNAITAGVEGFPEALRQQDVPVTELDWRPPADGNLELVNLMTRMETTPGLADRIESANREVIRRIQESNPLVVDVQSAGDAMGLPDKTISHAGPPIPFDRMCGPQQRAVMGAIQFEGWADTNEEAAGLLQSGAIDLAPNHLYRAVGPMTGVISPSMPVMVVLNETFGNYSFSTFNEGRGNTLWFGLFDDGTLERLIWMRDVLGPAMKAAFAEHGPFSIIDIVSQGLMMGDECHARHAASTSMLVKRLMPSMLDAGVSSSDVASIIRFADANNHFFLNFTMAGVKATMDAAHGVPYSTIVTALSRNGVDFMVRVSGSGDRWVVAPVKPMDEAVYYTGFSVDDAAGDIGDSAIIETCGLGGMALAGAPTVAPFVGGTLAHEVAAVKELEMITVAKHEKFRLSPMDMANTPLGIDIRRVVESRLVPFITTGVLHDKSPTVGQIGTGVARAPVGMFDDALLEFATHVEIETPTSERHVIEIKPVEGKA